MSDPLGTFGLLGVGLFCVALGVVGLQRGKVVGVFDWQKAKQPVHFWYGVVFQLGLGAVCIAMGAWKLFQ